MFQNLLHNGSIFLNKRTRFQLTVLSLVLLATVGALDYLTGYELSFSVFYLIPVAISAWYAGIHTGLVICVICAATWFLVDHVSGRQYSHFAIPFWNAGVRLGFFIIVASLLDRLHVALKFQTLHARQDGLTGILNNRAFRDHCHSISLLASRHGHSMVLGYIDLDNFKKVNDTAGHNVGDIILKSVANTLTGRLRETDLAGRLGGDEFAVLLPETDLASARIIFTQLREKLVQLASDQDWPIGFSIGVAVFNPPPAKPEDCVHFADELMYKVKKSGKNNILFGEYPEK